QVATVAGLLGASWRLFHTTVMSGYTYGSARTFIAMLESDPTLRARLDTFIARLHDGDEAGRAFADSFAGIGVDELQARFERFLRTRPVPLALPRYRGAVATPRAPPPAVERWLARARPWDSPRALAEAGRALARAA